MHDGELKAQDTRATMRSTHAGSTLRRSKYGVPEIGPGRLGQFDGGTQAFPGVSCSTKSIFDEQLAS